MYNYLLQADLLRRPVLLALDRHPLQRVQDLNAVYDLQGSPTENAQHNTAQGAETVSVLIKKQIRYIIRLPDQKWCTCYSNVAESYSL